MTYTCACGCGNGVSGPGWWVSAHVPNFPYADDEPRESSTFELWRGEAMVIDSTDGVWIKGLAKQIDDKGHGPCLVIERRTVVTLHVRYGGLS